jgi:hypothetical protein
MSKDKNGIETKYYAFNEVTRTYISKQPMSIFAQGTGSSNSSDLIWSEINNERKAIHTAGFKAEDTEL